MSETPEGMTPQQEADLAAQLAAQSGESPSAAGAQAESAAAMTDRGPVLPAEADIDAFMAEMRAKYNDMSAQLEAMKAQQASALAAQGGPLVTRYAQGAADKAAALAVQHPDAPQGHFAPLTAATAGLAKAAAALAGGGGAVADLERAAAAVARFAGKTHPRAWGKHIDWSALLDDVETAVEEGAKIAALV